MKWAHGFSVLFVYVVAWGVALVLAGQSGMSASVHFADLVHIVVWIVAGGIATLSALHEARLGRAVSVIKRSR